MNAGQNYGISSAAQNSVASTAILTTQAVHSPQQAANLSLLRLYLDRVFYPWVFAQAAGQLDQPSPTPTPDDQSKGQGDPFEGFNIDLSDFNVDLSDFNVDFSDLDLGFDDPEDSCVCYTPAQRVLMMHRLFVTFLGHRQGEWWGDYTQELIYFFGECGEPPVIVQIALRESVVMQTLRPFCS